MTDKIKNYVMEKTKELIGVPYCYEDLKTVAQEWLDALGTPGEATATKKYIAQLEEDTVSIDELINFLSSDGAAEYFGKEKAAKQLAQAKEAKASGTLYCDCLACTAALAILEKKDELL